jgi:hypothetical protein
MVQSKLNIPINMKCSLSLMFIHYFSFNNSGFTNTSKIKIVLINNDKFIMDYRLEFSKEIKTKVYDGLEYIS